MAEGNQNREKETLEPDRLEGLLDAALAKYASVEPRDGLEERVLANLRAERGRVPHRSWWSWAGMAAVGAAAVVAVALMWSSGKPSHPAVANHPSPTTREEQRSAARDAANEGGDKVGPPAPLPRRKRTGRRSQPPIVAVAEPKLDQFPSPQPLSEQEKVLESYVDEYPERAVLVARAQAEALRQDQEEEMRKSGTGSDNDLQQRKQ